MLTYNQAIEKLQSKGMFRIDLGLDRISKVLESFGNPQDELRCIHVAGTNGKGSVCAILDSVLREAGFITGLYTSPHIFNYTERIKVSEKDISEEDFTLYFEKVLYRAEELNISLTEFETLTVIMFLYFYDKKVDIVILETGMGGRFDATNVIKENLCSIITRIDLDHTDRLGETKEKIAFEKAGIIKSSCPVITTMGYEVIRERADNLDSMLILTSPYADNKFIEALSLKGLHQTENLALVLTALEYKFPEISKDIIIRGLSKVKHKFRFEYFPDKNLIIDGCHNPNGVETLKNNLDYYYPRQKRRFVFGALKAKDYKKMMNVLFEEGDEIYLNAFNYPNACTFNELLNACPIKAKRYDTSVNLTTDKLNIVCGSFYMIGMMNLHT